MDENSDALISPEILVPRLGEQLVGMQLLSSEQLTQALAYQAQCQERGRQILLGQAIMEMGFLDRPTLDRAVTEQIVLLRAALEDANHNLELRVKQRTLELETALRRLSEINQLKANLIANISHELRTPLTHIHGYLDLLSTEALGDLNLDQKKALSVSLQSSIRLQSLIDDLILFSQISRGQITLNVGPVDLNKLTSGMVARFKPRAEEHKLVFDASQDGGPLTAQADEEKLFWVVGQLLDNAIKFTNPGGKVTLLIHRDETAENLVIISVADTGIGIEPQRIKEMFEPFHQLDGSATRRYGGTGLGLALVSQIIEAHGSLVTVQSELNKGTTISFPLLITKGD